MPVHPAVIYCDCQNHTAQNPGYWKISHDFCIMKKLKWAYILQLNWAFLWEIYADICMDTHEHCHWAAGTSDALWD